MEHGKIVKPTQAQYHKGTKILNGNRYLVLDAEGKGTIPSEISILTQKGVHKKISFATLVNHGHVGDVRNFNKKIFNQDRHCDLFGLNVEGN